MNTLLRMSLAGFKSIREMRDLEFKPLNILIGANGAGKSNLTNSRGERPRFNDWISNLEAIAAEP